MSAQTLLVVVGSSDDALRVKRLNRSMEGVSQTMIDSMIMVCSMQDIGPLPKKKD